MSEQLNTKMDLKWQEFQAVLERVKKKTDKTACQVVVSNSRKLVKKFAWLAPIDTGRLRAGFWPAAMSLQMANIFTRHPNKGEGMGINRTPQKKPFVMIVNSVPYVANAGGRGTSWWFAAITGITQRMIRELEQGLKKDWAP